MRIITVLLLMILPLGSMAQSLFENAGDQNDTNQSGSLRIGGFIRGVSYLGKDRLIKGMEMKSAYGQTALQLEASKPGFGKAYADIRFRSGYEYGADVQNLLIREAYADAKIWKFNLRIGKQIIQWGKADGLNPTDVITPSDITVRSPQEDDMRMGNFLAKLDFYPLQNLGLEFLWIPKYQASVLPLKWADVPDYVLIQNPVYPTGNIENSMWALKAKTNFGFADFSLSWYKGYGLLPGIAQGFPVLQADSSYLPALHFKAYEQEMIGFDFSTSLSSFGLRGELAYKITKDYEMHPEVPNPELSWALGIEKSIGAFRFIAQYFGKYIIDFEDLRPSLNPAEMFGYQLSVYNRLFQSQTKEFLHTLMLRPSLQLFNEALNVEVVGMYNISTEEIFLYPKLRYAFNGSLSMTGGYCYYHGNDGSLYHFIENPLSGPFIELRYSF